MADIDTFRVNGNIVSWPDVVTKIDGKRINGITGLTYGDKRERVKAYGQGRHYKPRGRTRGKYAPDNVKVTLHKDSARSLRAQLAAKSTDGVSYGNVEFELSIQYVADNGDPIHLQFQRCTIVSDSSSEDENPDPLKDELELDTMGILRNGLTLFDSSQGGAP